MSVATHALLVAVWVAATLPAASLPVDGLPNRLYYIPPPDKPPPSVGSRETIRYIALGQGQGPGPASFDPEKPISDAPPTRDVGGAPDTTTSSPPAVPSPGDQNKDSVFTEIEVDSAVVRSKLSAAPAYPIDLLAKHIEGTAVVRYIVDTTGFADVESFTVIRTTDSGFARAVREALPYMRFSPAKIGAKKVRQLVEQPFSFKISPTLANGSKP